jgi:MarR family transcriptional regulator, multiple antibiotic resistance protein MarR
MRPSKATGWVVRQPNPPDRRSSLLVLTDDGVRLVDLVDAAERTFTERVTELIGGTLGRTRVAAGAEVLAPLRAALECDQIDMPTG